MFNWDYYGTTGSPTLTLNAGVGYQATEFSTTLVNSPNFTTNLAISINPNLATNNVQYFVNGTLLGTDTYNGVIGGLWFKGDFEDNAGDGYTISNLMVATATPEPASLGLFGIAALGLLRRRGRTA